MELLIIINILNECCQLFQQHFRTWLQHKAVAHVGDTGQLCRGETTWCDKNLTFEHHIRKMHWIVPGNLVYAVRQWADWSLTGCCLENAHLLYTVVWSTSGPTGFYTFSHKFNQYLLKVSNSKSVKQRVVSIHCGVWEMRKCLRVTVNVFIHSYRPGPSGYKGIVMSCKEDLLLHSCIDRSNKPRLSSLQ